MRRASLLLLLALAGCGGLEDSVRDLNRSLYRTWAGPDRRAERPAAANAGETTPCFSADTGLLYSSQTGRCAPGYTAVPIERAEREFGSSAGTRVTAGNATTQPAVPPAASAAAPALCYDDAQGQVFEAASCPPNARWITAAEAQAVQQAQLAGASWCYFAARRLLYRSRACRPGDQILTVAQADALWEQLSPTRRPRARPAQAGGTEAVPPVQASPRGGVSATPLPVPR